MTVAASGAMGGRCLPTVKLASRDLFHDCLSLIVTLVGVVFLVVLVAAKCSRRLRSENRIAAILDQTQADLWGVPVGIKSIDDPSLLPDQEKHAIFPRGVARMEELVVGFVAERELSGGATAALRVGSQARSNRSLPSDSIAGSLTERISPSAKGIRAFMTYVFTTVGLARQLLDATPKSCDEVARVTPGDNMEDVRTALQARLPGVELIAHQGFRKRGLDSWLFGIRAGTALIAAMGILLSVPVIYLRDTAPLSVMTTKLALLLLVLTVAMDVFAAISAAKRTRSDPVVGFRR
jgi:putative ABC transport system permease protein